MEGTAWLRAVMSGDKMAVLDVAVAVSSRTTQAAEGLKAVCYMMLTLLVLAG